MSGRRDESLVLDDIVDAVSRLIDLGNAIPAGMLGSDRGLNEMILWNLVVLGESAKRLDVGTHQRFADVPWNAMARTRDRVAHHYEGVDWQTIAQILKDELPTRLPRLIEIRDTVRTEFEVG